MRNLKKYIQSTNIYIHCLPTSFDRTEISFCVEINELKAANTVLSWLASAGYKILRIMGGLSLSGDTVIIYGGGNVTEASRNPAICGTHRWT